MSTIAMLVGGVLGVFLPNLLEGPRTNDTTQRRRSLLISVLGGLVLGALTGAAITGPLTGVPGSGLSDGPATVPAVGLSSSISPPRPRPSTVSRQRTPAFYACHSAIRSRWAGAWW